MLTLYKQPKSRFPFTIGGAGGFMGPGQKGKGYYGLLKRAEALTLEERGWENYGEGSTPMRADMYQSYGWLNAFSYKDNKLYSHRGAEAYLNINERTKRANKASGYEMVWRPVYSKAKKNPWFLHQPSRTKPFRLRSCPKITPSYVPSRFVFGDNPTTRKGGPSRHRLRSCTNPSASHTQTTNTVARRSLPATSKGLHPKSNA